MIRPRRLRRSQIIRDMVCENQLDPRQWVYPLFLVEGSAQQVPIDSMPGQFQCSIDVTLKEIERAWGLGLRSFAIFPKIDPKLKDPFGRESVNKNGLVPRAIAAIKDRYPQCLLFADVALDPYTDHGHDGIVENGIVVNDPTVERLCDQAVLHAAMGADWVAPSDMMDGRIGAIRRALDDCGHTDTAILSYCAKYASQFYGPFRSAIASAPLSGLNDKRSYQLNPANRKEAHRELLLDTAEGADALMVKPALSYLDIIADFKRHSKVPVAAYNVSGEYAMVKAASARGWLNEKGIVLEILLSIRRAGADMIWTYHAVEAAQWLDSL